MKTLARFFALVLTLSIPAVAMAEEDAEALFHRGAQAYQEGRYEDAVDLFLTAYQADPQPELLYNVAQAYERLGDVRNALRAYRDYLRQNPSPEDRAIVSKRVENLERRLREGGIQQISVFSSPPGAVVALDGTEMGETPWTGEVPPGRHAITLRLEGYVETRREFVLAAERAMDIEVSLTPERAIAGPTTAPAGSAAQAAPKDQPPERAGLSRVEPWTWAALGVGAVGLGGAVGFEIARAGAERDAQSAETQLAHQERYHAMEDRQLAARVLLGIGAAATVAGGVLLYFDLSRESDAESASRSSAPRPPQRSEVSWRVGAGCNAALCQVVSHAKF